MESFGDNFVENEADPAADFLAREQNELAGLEDELTPSDPPLVNGDGGGLSASDLASGPEDLGIDDTPAVEESVGSFDDVSPPVVETVRERREEPEKIKKWREEQAKCLEEKDRLEEEKKEEWRLTAKKELEEWYRHHEDHITKTRANNRNNENHLDQEEPPSTDSDWKRIAKLCDFNKKSTHNTKDASRMRSIILQLQQSPRKTKSV